MADLKGVHIDGCIPAPMRRTLEALADRDEQINLQGPTHLNNQPASYYLNIANSTGGPFSQNVILTMFREGALAGDLARDSTATLNLYDPTTDAVYSPNQTITVDGFYVPTGKKIPSGARIGAKWNGVCWRAMVTDTCVVDV